MECPISVSTCSTDDNPVNDSKVNRVVKALERVRKRLNQAFESSRLGRLPRAEGQAASARKKTQAVISLLDRRCPGQIDCLLPELDEMARILAELEENLAVNQQ